MRDPALERYLAQHYHSGPKAEALLERYGDGEKRKKKKRRKHDDGGGALTIKEDNNLWFGGADASDDDVPAQHEKGTDAGEAVIQGESSRAGGWTTLRDGRQRAEQAAAPADAAASAPPAPTPGPSDPGVTPEQRAAGPVPEQSAAGQAADAGAPAAPAPPTVKAGLMTREELRAMRKARQEQEEAARAQERAEQEAQDPSHHETVYRDTQGRRINLEEEEARLREEQERAERKRKEREQWGQGLVQRREREAQRNELRAMRSEGVARTAEDAAMNDTLRARMHWDDPARAFLSRRSGPRVTRPQYQGPPPPPNRFNIQPGYRWDGVDRGNGFERKLFMRMNQKDRAHDEHRAWATEDM